MLSVILLMLIVIGLGCSNENPETVPPIRAGGYQAEFVVGMAAATATMIALYRKISKNL